MKLNYYNKVKKEMSHRFTLHRKPYAWCDDHKFKYTILKDGVFFNPWGEGYKSTHFSYDEKVTEDEAINALKETIRCAAREYIHNMWVERDKKRKEMEFQKRVRKGIE